MVSGGSPGKHTANCAAPGQSDLTEISAGAFRFRRMQMYMMPAVWKPCHHFQMAEISPACDEYLDLVA
jgi:hypothetical protein